MILRRIFALLAVLAFASPAAAGGDLCFNPNNQSYPTYIFKKAKLPTKPNDARPLTGVNATGVAFTTETGTLLLLVTISGQCIADVLMDGQLVGTASIGCTNGSGRLETWRPVACP